MTARDLLRPLRSRGLSSARFHGYLAASFLDLRDYHAAGEACRSGAWGGNAGVAVRRGKPLMRERP